MAKIQGKGVVSFIHSYTWSLLTRDSLSFQLQWPWFTLLFNQSSFIFSHCKPVVSKNCILGPWTLIRPTLQRRQWHMESFLERHLLHPPTNCPLQSGAQVEQEGSPVLQPNALCEPPGAFHFIPQNLWQFVAVTQLMCRILLRWLGEVNRQGMDLQGNMKGKGRVKNLPLANSPVPFTADI